MCVVIHVHVTYILGHPDKRRLSTTSRLCYQFLNQTHQLCRLAIVKKNLKPASINNHPKAKENSKKILITKFKKYIQRETCRTLAYTRRVGIISDACYLGLLRYCTYCDWALEQLAAVLQNVKCLVKRHTAEWHVAQQEESHKWVRLKSKQCCMSQIQCTDLTPSGRGHLGEGDAARHNVAQNTCHRQYAYRDQQWWV